MTIYYTSRTDKRDSGKSAYYRGLGGKKVYIGPKDGPGRDELGHIVRALEAVDADIEETMKRKDADREYLLKRLGRYMAGLQKDGKK